MADLAFLAGVVWLAFTVQTALGFGATLIALALGALRLPVPELVPVLVAVNVVATASVLAWDRGRVDRVLLGRIFPAMVPGLVAGSLLAGVLADAALQRAYGVLVVAVAVAGLWRLARARPAAAGPRSVAKGPPRASLVIGAAGVVHGLFATGGPLLVLAVDRLGLDKGAFRTTLTAVWLVLNLLLTALFVVRGALDAEAAVAIAALLPAVALALAAGQWLHAGLAPRALRASVLVLLLGAGVGLVA